MNAQRTTTHTSFTIERTYNAPVTAVYAAWADPVAKRRWSDCHPEYTTDYRLDFRPLGHESHRVVYPNQSVQEIEKVFFDIVPDQRIVFTYDVRLDQRRFSVSLVTVEFLAVAGGTQMVYIEQLTYLDGHEDSAQRIEGTQEGLDRLALELHAAPPVQ